MAVILAYHRVAPPENDPFGLCVHPARFEGHIEHLRRRCHPLPLPELAAGVVRGDLPAGAVAVTLDDGYRDALTTASPTLTRFEVPATFFVTTGGLPRPGPYWWDVLAWVLSGRHGMPPALDLEALPGAVATGTREERERALRALHRQMLSQSPEECDTLLSRIVEWSGVDVAGHDGGWPMTAEEITELASHPGHSIGCHSARHLLLPGQPLDVQRIEVAGSKERLEGLLGGPVKEFCYPFGAWDQATVDLVREAGFQAAVTVLEGRVDRSADPLLLPRVEVGDCDVESFARRLWPLLG